MTSITVHLLTVQLASRHRLNPIRSAMLSNQIASKVGKNANLAAWDIVARQSVAVRQSGFELVAGADVSP